MKNTKVTAPSVWSIFIIFLKLGLTSFGGPVAHLGYFRHEFVEQRQWLSEKSYADMDAFGCHLYLWRNRFHHANHQRKPTRYAAHISIHAPKRVILVKPICYITARFTISCRHISSHLIPTSGYLLSRRFFSLWWRSCGFTLVAGGNYPQFT